MADVSQGWPWQLPLLATPACVRCHPPPLRDGWDQVLTDTGDAGDVAAAASVTRDRRGQAALAAPAGVQLQCCQLAVAITPGALLQSAVLHHRDLANTNSKQRPGPGLLPSPGYFPIANITYTP